MRFVQLMCENHIPKRQRLFTANALPAIVKYGGGGSPQYSAMEWGGGWRAIGTGVWQTDMPLDIKHCQWHSAVIITRTHAPLLRSVCQVRRRSWDARQAVHVPVRFRNPRGPFVDARDDPSVRGVDRPPARPLHREPARMRGVVGEGPALPPRTHTRTRRHTDSLILSQHALGYPPPPTHPPLTSAPPAPSLPSLTSGRRVWESLRSPPVPPRVAPLILV
jgi:hypothetical protein